MNHWSLGLMAASGQQADRDLGDRRHAKNLKAWTLFDIGSHCESTSILRVPPSLVCKMYVAFC